MKKTLLLAVLVLMAAGPVGAQVTGEVIAKDMDNSGNIVVKTQYKINGVEVESRYPVLEGKHYFVTRYNAVRVDGMSAEEVEALIEKDIESHIDMLVQREYFKKANAENIDTKFSGVVGKTLQKTESIFRIDTDSDGVLDEEWTVNINGQRAIKNISVPRAPVE